MATADCLKEYLQFDKMEEGSEKAELSQLLDEVDADNNEYVKTWLQADTNAFIADKVSPEVQNMHTVIQRLANAGLTRSSPPSSRTTKR